MNTEYWLQRFDKSIQKGDGFSDNYNQSIQHDFYSVRLKRNEDIYLLQGYQSGVISALKLEGGRFCVPVEFNKNEFEPDQFQVKHYYKSRIFSYNTLYGLRYRDKAARIRTFFYNIFNNIDQYQYNRRKIQIDDRMSILQILVDHETSGGNAFGISAPTILSHMVSERFFYHPDREKLIKTIKFYLSALIKSGDVAYKESYYKALPQALITSENYNKNQKKECHDKYIKNWTLLITIIAGIFAIISAWGTLVQAEILPKWYGLNPHHEVEKNNCSQTNR
ncbi:MAG TPA: hypothetical protein VGC17_08270 [Lactovum miscens]|uniref:hypothetical protein n=1 Tax=Lactovum miscens TaxID=190387 RepID=UPI002EDAABCF